MKYLPTLAAVCLLIGPSVGIAQQISPNPNLVGNTITVDTPTYYNWGDNTDHFANAGSINITSNGQLENRADLTNWAILTNGPTGVISIEGKFLNKRFGGSLANLNNEGVVNVQGLIDNSGWIINYIGATLTNETDGWINNDGHLNNDGSLISNSGLVNKGTLINEGHGTLKNNSGLTNTGTLTNYGVAVNNDTVDIYEGTLTNYSTFFNHNDMTNYGTLANDVYFEASGALINNGTLTNQPGGTLTNNGTIDTTNGTFTNNGTLNGDGKIIGNHSDYGVTSPGNSAGVMTIEGDYFKVDGSKEIELGGLFDGGGDNALAEFDRIDVTGNVELAGLLNVSLIDGFEKRINRGQVFEFLRVGGTLSGQYEGLGEGALVGNFGGQDLFITYGGMGDGGGVALYTNAVPEPTTVLIWSMLAGLGVTVRRRR